MLKIKNHLEKMHTCSSVQKRKTITKQYNQTLDKTNMSKTSNSFILLKKVFSDIL